MNFNILLITQKKMAQKLPKKGYARLLQPTWLILLLMTVFIWQCKKDTYTGETKGVCPEVILTDPLKDAVNVPISKIITADFNEAMNPATITGTTFLLKQGTTAISGVVSYSGVKATFAPAAPLAPFTLYSATITKAAKDPAKNALKADYVWSFTTQPLVTLSSNPVLGGTTTGGGLLNSGTVITVGATANAGFAFLNWTEAGNVVSTLANYPFTLAGNRTLVTNFTVQYVLGLSANPIAGGTTSGGGAFNAGSTATAVATANPGYLFTNWTEAGVVVSTLASYPVTISGNRTLVANFTAQYNLALSSLPVAGGTTTGSGTFNSGVTVTATAVANTGYVFKNWTEAGVAVSTLAIYPFTISANRTLVANFTAQYTLALSPLPLLGGITTGGGTFNAGASVTATATANAGYVFTNWTEAGTIVSTLAVYPLTLNANRILVANFVVGTAQLTVTLSANPLAGGITTGGGSFNSGASVTAAAVANVGYVFTNWTEGIIVASTNANYTFNVTANRTLVANFTLSGTGGAGPLTIDLGCAKPFAVLAGSTVTSTGPSIINGDVGLSPGSALIGFPPGIINGAQQITTAVAAAAKLCLTTAFLDGQNRSLNALPLPGQLGGLKLAPGLYTNSSTSGISGTGVNGILTLDAGGNANAVWIFQMGSTLTTDPGTSVELTGGAKADNVFWIVGSSATLGTNSTFSGNILAMQAVTLNTGATLNGRALTQIAAVSMDASTITKP